MFYSFSVGRPDVDWSTESRIDGIEARTASKRRQDIGHGYQDFVKTRSEEIRGQTGLSQMNGSPGLTGSCEFFRGSRVSLPEISLS